MLAVLADGRVIDINTVTTDGILKRRRLSGAGVAWLEGKLQSSGLFTEDRTLKPSPYPGPGAGDAIQLVTADQSVTVRRELGWIAESTPELDQFNALLGLLESLPQSVPAQLWAELAPVPYIAATDALCIALWGRAPDPADRPATDWVDVTWPVKLDPAVWGAPAPEPPGARCAAVDFETARQVEVAGADAREPGPLLESGAASVGFDFDWAAGDGTIYLTLTPIPPGHAQ